MTFGPSRQAGRRRQAAVHARRTAAAVLATSLAVALSTASATGYSISLNPTPAEPPQATTATIAVSLSPDRAGARAALTLTIRYTGGEFGVPSAVRRSVLRFPAGMSLDIPSLRSCSAVRLRARGVSGCPARSQIGTGHALVETRAGSQIVTEDVALRAFLGPPQNLEPTFEILAQGYTPLEERVVFTGSVLTDSAPYGEQLDMSIPPVPTLPMEPDASIVTFSLTVGTSARRGTHGQNAVLVPSTCPFGGFPVAVEFTYADGSDGSARATIPCPR